MGTARFVMFIDMSRRKQYGLLLLMALALLAIIAFQSHWLYKSYRDQQAALNVRANFLFRDAITGLHLQQLQSDANFTVAADSMVVRPMKDQDRQQVVSMLSVVRGKTDSLRKAGSKATTMIITSNKSKAIFFNATDSSQLPPSAIAPMIQYKGNPVTNVLWQLDSAQDSLRIKDISVAFGDRLRDEQLPLLYSVSRLEGTREESFPNLEKPEVTIGFARPLTFTYELKNAQSFILQKILPQILISLMLVGLTAVSFLLLYRNLRRQQRLTAIKNEFISNITHELKTPIATVGVAIEAMKNFNVLDNPQRTREYLDIAGQEVHRLGLLVDKVLKLSMFEQEQTELKPEWFNLEVLAREVIASLQLQIEKRQAEVALKLEGRQFDIHADRMHLSSVLFNLLDNALKYSRENPRIELTLRELGSHVGIVVEDNGIGIPPEYRSRIFEKFFRVPQGNQHNVKGYGLGLSYVAHIIQLHRGSIDIVSEEGKGTRFEIQIPRGET